MAKQGHLLSLLSFLSILLLFLSEPSSSSKQTIRVGVLLNMNSTLGNMAMICLSTALSDFYALNSNYRTRLSLVSKDSGDDVIDAASSALELIEKEQVYAIIGPQRSEQAKFVIELGKKSQVPIISFSATSPSLSTTQDPFFIRTTYDDQSQVKAITSIVQAYGWREVVLVYEDTEFGNGLVPYLTDALQQVDTRVPYRCVIPPSSTGFKILKLLNGLMSRQTRVFLVHMTASLGSRLFLLAHQAGMMSEGYAWIITDGLSSLLSPVQPKVIDSMQGVLGIRPYIPVSQRLREFEIMWKRKYQTNDSNNVVSELNLFGLWAYDMVWALAMTVEMVKPSDSIMFEPKENTNLSNFSVSRVSKLGPRLVKMMPYIRFEGLSGNFELVQGQLKPYAFEIFNVVGKEERVIGYWTRKRGMSYKLDHHLSNKETYSTFIDSLEAPTWPGGTKKQPKGWVIPVTGKKLRIGVPVVIYFQQFFKIEWDARTNEPIFSGFSYDVFLAALELLPFAVPHKFIPFVNNSRQSAGTYDELLYQIKLRKFDAVVGDFTITANRSQYVDFTFPYMESSLSMVVKIKNDEKKNIWIFLKPLSWDLWLTTGLAFMLTGFVVWVLEHRINTEFRGSPEQQLGTIFWFSFSTLVFAHREKVMSNLTRFVLIIWIFVVLILTQSYTASLASMLTIKRLQPEVDDLKELRKNGDFVGYRSPFVGEYLIKHFNFGKSKLKHYDSPESALQALSNGSHNGGVAAIFDEVPYARLYLSKHCDKYTMVGPIYKAEGIAFAFPQGSPLVSYISRAILNVIEDPDKIQAIERKYFDHQTTCSDKGTIVNSDSFSVYSFGGLFIIAGAASMSSLLIHITKFFGLHSGDLKYIHLKSSFWSTMAKMTKFFDTNEPLERVHGHSELVVPSVIRSEGVEALTVGTRKLRHRARSF